MAATTVAIPMSQSAADKLESALYYKLKAATFIPAGSLAMRVQNQDYVEPYVAGTVGAILMGVAEQDYDNLAGVGVKTFGDREPMVFRRGVFYQFKSDGSITADDHVMTRVALKDNQTIGMPVAGGDCTVLLTGIDRRTGSAVYAISIDQSGPTT